MSESRDFRGGKENEMKHLEECECKETVGAVSDHYRQQ